MKMLSLWEPWATLMAVGAKRIETRSWATSYTGWLAIHASKGGLSKSALRECIAEPEFAAALGAADLSPGRIVAVVRLMECIPTQFIGTLNENETAFGDYHAGRWAWVTQDLFRLPRPIAARGRQGLKDVSADVLDQIRRQWKESRP